MFSNLAVHYQYVHVVSAAAARAGQDRGLGLC